MLIIRANLVRYSLIYVDYVLVTFSYEYSTQTHYKEHPFPKFYSDEFVKKIIYGILPPQVMKVRDRVEISKTIKTLPYFYVPI